jgi:hypothetical protein
MKKTFLCSKESPLHQQIAEEEQLMISEIYIKGYLGGDELMLLSDLSKNGRLRLLDMYDVRELYTNDLEKDGTRDCFPFFDNDRIEEVRLPQISSIDYGGILSYTKQESERFILILQQPHPRQILL